MRAVTPGSLKKTAVVPARLRPSTTSSVVAPRGMPRGETELMVGGVVRLPVGDSVVLAANAAPAQAKARIAFICLSPPLNLSIHLKRAVEAADGEAVAIGREG